MSNIMNWKGNGQTAFQGVVSLPIGDDLVYLRIVLLQHIAFKAEEVYGYANPRVDWTGDCQNDLA